MTPDIVPSELGSPVDRQRLDQFKRFLTHSPPKGQEDYWNERSQLLGPELSVANLERTDMMANTKVVMAILELLENGQIGLARFLMTMYINDLKSTMSLEGVDKKFIGQLLSHKIEYSQTQAVHEYQHPAQKKGFFRR